MEPNILQTTRPVHPNDQARSLESSLFKLALACPGLLIMGAMLYRGLGLESPLTGGITLLTLSLASMAIPAFYGMLFNEKGAAFMDQFSTTLVFSNLLVVPTGIVLFIDGVFPAELLSYAFQLIAFSWGLAFFLNLIWGIKNGKAVFWCLLSAKIFLTGIFIWYQFILSPEQSALVYNALF